jgi:tryptophan synthase
VCLLQLQSALVTYVTAGYPTAQETPDIMLGMEAGGAGKYSTFSKSGPLWTNQLTCIDLIELGMPFTDPIADGPTIQKSNTVCDLFATLTFQQYLIHII